MLRRIIPVVLLTMALAGLATSCGSECSEPSDCARSRGPAPAGMAYTCNQGTCATTGQQPQSDAGTDGGTDGGTLPLTPSQQIEAFRSSPTGSALSLPIEDAFVTYLKPDVGGEAGFFLQAEPDGPALFVSDAAALAQVQVGDKVSLTVTEKVLLSGVQVAKTVTGLTITSRNHPVQNLASAAEPGLLVDHSSTADLATNADSYESELLSLTGEITSTASGAGSGHVAFNIKTAGIPTPPTTAAFRLRISTTLAGQLDITPGCTFTIKAVPLWRFTNNSGFTTAQPSAYSTSDLTLDCPAPTLTSASSSSPTQVLLTFDRLIDASSITDAATQFTFDNGLTASAASVSGRQVTLTTSIQQAGTQYTVTVADSVKDTAGKAVSASANTASFSRVAIATRGGRLNLAGSGFTGATNVTVGGESQAFTVDSDTSLTIAALAETTPTGTSQPIIVTTPAGTLDLGQTAVIDLVINELDSDTANVVNTSTDNLEFIEIATGVPNLELTGAGFSLVLFNGNGDVSYLALDLSGTTNADGLLLIGNPGVTPAPTVTFSNGTLQNGVDAAALYQAPATTFPNGTAVTSTSLLDAIVYETNDPDDTGLLDGLLGAAGAPERIQADESLGGAPVTNSIQRCGPGRRDGRVFSLVAAPSPGAPNTCP